MAKLLIQSIGCPNCGAPYEPDTRHCRFCGSVLIVTALAETFERKIDAYQVSEAVDKWRQQLKQDADSAEAHYALGLSYLNSKLRDAALEHLRKAALLAPEVPDTHHNLALTLFNDGNIQLASSEYAEAMKEIDYSIRLAPDFSEAMAFKHFFLARKLDAVDNAQAMAEYAKAIEACPDIATLHNNLGMCYLNAKRYVQAQACFRKAIELDAGYAMAHSNLCLVLYFQKEYAEGVETGTKAISLMGPATLEELQALAHSNLALCLWKSRRKSEALEHLNKAIALNPANPLFSQNLQAIKTSCFVVTATMGSSSHPWILELTTFRDFVLSRSVPGRWLISQYERQSPVLARLIASSLLLRRLSCAFVVLPAVCILRLLTLGRCHRWRER